MRQPEVRIVFALASITIIGLAGFLLWQSKQASSLQTSAIWDTTRPISGNQHATIQLVEFGDFQCPTCKAMAPQLTELLSSEPKMALQFRYFPLPEHKNAFSAAKAAEAAAQMNSFWPMHNLLFKNQDNWSNLDNTNISFAKFAVLLGLDETTFSANFADAGSRVQIDMDLGRRIGVVGTPTFFINGRLYDGPLSEDGLKKAIDLLHL